MSMDKISRMIFALLFLLASRFCLLIVHIMSVNIATGLIQSKKPEKNDVH